MKENNKNRNNYLSDLIRYTRGEMTKREENAFQRKLQKDPFAAEAAEGFSEISPSEANDDVQHLGKQIKNRTTHRQRIVFYRIAASVAVLMVISSVFLYIDRNKPPKQFSQQTVKPASGEKLNDVGQPSEPIVTDSKNLMAAPEKEADYAILDVRKETALPPVAENPPAAQISEALPTPESKDSILYVAENKITEPQVKADTQPQAISEEVAAGDFADRNARAAAGAVNKAENAVASYNPPQPVNGQESFDNYVSGNIQKPADLVSGQTATVVVAFIVRSSGALDSINVITSPGKEYSDESVRLIREGPAWRPAERNNEKIDDKVRLSIVFK
jgi:hypothetical protein